MPATYQGHLEIKFKILKIYYKCNLFKIWILEWLAKIKKFYIKIKDAIEFLFFRSRKILILTL